MGNKVVLITGASSGIGQACAERLYRRSHKVYGAGRSSIKEISAGYRTIVMDVNEDRSVIAGVQQIMDAEK